MIRVYDITPCPKPRMTRADRWKKRPCVTRYWAYKDAVKAAGVTLPEGGFHVIFVLPMPNSWSRKKKLRNEGQPVKSKPDRDNLDKGLADAIFSDDAHLWDGRVSKVWGWCGKIVVVDGIDDPLETCRKILDGENPYGVSEGVDGGV